MEHIPDSSQWADSVQKVKIIDVPAKDGWYFTGWVLALCFAVVLIMLTIKLGMVLFS